jgi:hypothetical protein
VIKNIDILCEYEAEFKKALACEPGVLGGLFDEQKLKVEILLTLSLSYIEIFQDYRFAKNLEYLKSFRGFIS